MLVYKIKSEQYSISFLRSIGELIMGTNHYIKYFTFLLFFISYVAPTKERSLAFVIDTTGSMSDELKLIKKGTGLIIDAMTRLTEPSIGSFILVPFNDPGIIKNNICILSCWWYI